MKILLLFSFLFFLFSCEKNECVCYECLQNTQIIVNIPGGSPMIYQQNDTIIFCEGLPKDNTEYSLNKEKITTYKCLKLYNSN